MRSPDHYTSPLPAKMESYPSRSPQDRTWGGRDERHRSIDRADRPERERDTFYRGRSPGMLSFIIYLHLSESKKRQ